MRRRNVRLTPAILDGILRRGGVQLDFPLTASERAQLAHYVGRRWLRRYEDEVCGLVRLGRHSRYEQLEREYETEVANVFQPVINKLTKQVAKQLLDDFATTMEQTFGPVFDVVRKGFEQVGAALTGLIAAVEAPTPRPACNPPTDVQLLTVAVHRKGRRPFLLSAGVKAHGAVGKYAEPGTKQQRGKPPTSGDLHAGSSLDRFRRRLAFVTGRTA